MLQVLQVRQEPQGSELLALRDLQGSEPQAQLVRQVFRVPQVQRELPDQQEQEQPVLQVLRVRPEPQE